jgi:hypothetical protein
VGIWSGIDPGWIVFDDIGLVGWRSCSRSSHRQLIRYLLTSLRVNINVTMTVGPDCGDRFSVRQRTRLGTAASQACEKNQEAMMASRPKAAEAAELIADFNPNLVWWRGPHGCGPAITDPAVGGVEQTVFFMQLDKPTQNTLMAAKLEGEAAILRATADAHTKIAEILKSRG